MDVKWQIYYEVSEKKTQSLNDYLIFNLFFFFLRKEKSVGSELSVVIGRRWYLVKENQGCVLTFKPQ